MKLRVNGVEHVIESAWEEERLLSTLRERFGLVGAKYGCGVGDCGVCVVHLDGAARRSCLIATRDAAGAEVTTIEGLSGADGRLHPLQEAWIEGRVAQCGYCQAGQIMQAAALLRANPAPSDAEIAAAMAGNLCRCGTFLRVRAAIRQAAALRAANRQAAALRAANRQAAALRAAPLGLGAEEAADR